MKKPHTIVKSARFAFWYGFYRMPLIFVSLYLSCYSSFLEKKRKKKEANMSIQQNKPTQQQQQQQK